MWNILIENLPKKWRDTKQHRPPGVRLPHQELFLEGSRIRAESKLKKFENNLKEKLGDKKAWDTVEASEALGIPVESARYYMKKLVKKNVLSSIVVMQPNKYYLFCWRGKDEITNAEDEGKTD